ncbi:DUF317 domain-containing protein [Streptomyces sp. CoT10]|uniref:DUF317 domain-containing protein n=1 Tax=Streptomyces sp. CoT10 TaxID=2875762 RepID=UPI001CD5C733|nr:DUF317 domain-containing protein [Streptomyces sp. CoT10]
MYLYQQSPDRHAYFALRMGHLDDSMESEGEGPAQWTMYGCVNQVNGECWHADFTSATPLYLVHEAVLALSNTEPVERPLSGIAERNLPYVTVSPVGAGADPRRSAALASTPNTPQAGATPPISSAAARARPLTPPLTTPLEELCRTTRTTSGGASTTSPRDTRPDRPSPAIPPSSPSLTRIGN